MINPERPGRAAANDHLAENVMHFARVLRAAGLPVGRDRVQLALQALQLGGGVLASRRDFKATLAACLIARPAHRLLFDQAFALFWRDPDLLARAMAMLLPSVQAKPGAPAPPENRRLAEALFPAFPHAPKPEPPPAEELIELDAWLTQSADEVLRQRDFDTMSPEEWRAAQQALARLSASAFFPRLPTRRTQRSARPGQADWRASLRAMARQGSGAWAMRWKAPREVAAPLVVLADISGSMSRYARMLLHFAHALASAPASRHLPRVECFVFGTRLTPISRLMRQRDPDLAVSAVARAVPDWSGGTRLSACLQDFNRHWARRVLQPSRSTVLLITDGLEATTPEDPNCEALAQAAQRLRGNCRRLIWLNPLLRFPGFEARAAGMRALRPQVHALLPAHNLASLQALAEVLAEA